MKIFKKADTASQAFIYIFTLFVIAFLLFMGVKWLLSLMALGEDINVSRVKIDLENSFDSIKTRYGSRAVKTFTIPNEVSVVCFFGESYSGGDICDSLKDDYNPILCELGKDQGINVLFFPLGNIPIYLPDLEIADEDYLCFDVTNGKIKVRLQSLGNKVKISEPS